MRLGILGAGKIVNEILPVIKEIDGIKVRAIAARNEEKLKKLTEEYQIEKYYLSIEDLLNDDEIEVIYIGLPNNLHYEAMKKAIEKGKDIICEKPFTSNFNQTEEIINLAKEKEIIILEAISHRFITNSIKAKEMIKDLGDIKIVSLNYSQYSSRYDDFKKDIIAPAFSKEFAGGALMDINLYNISFVVDIFGPAKDVKYFANIEKGIDTSGILILDYGNFKATLIGSKDSVAKTSNTIQGNKKTMQILGSVSTFEKFEIINTDGSKESFDFNLANKHRLYYEFVKFEEIIDKRDRETSDQLLELTKNYMEVLTKARYFAKIYYPDDKILE